MCLQCTCIYTHTHVQCALHCTCVCVCVFVLCVCVCVCVCVFVVHAVFYKAFFALFVWLVQIFLADSARVWRTAEEAAATVHHWL